MNRNSFSNNKIYEAACSSINRVIRNSICGKTIDLFSRKLARHQLAVVAHRKDEIGELSGSDEADI